MKRRFRWLALFLMVGLVIAGVVISKKYYPIIIRIKLVADPAEAAAAAATEKTRHRVIDTDVSVVGSGMVFIPASNSATHEVYADSWTVLGNNDTSIRGIDPEFDQDVSTCCKEIAAKNGWQIIQTRKVFEPSGITKFQTSIKFTFTGVLISYTLKGKK